MKRFRRCVALLVLGAIAGWSSVGCLSVGVQKTGKAEPGVGTGSLTVNVYERRPRNGAGDPPRHPLVSELRRVEGSKEIPIRETSESRWSDDALSPGKYRLRIARFIDEGGETHSLASPVQRTFRIRPGETVAAEIVVKRFPTGTVVGAVAAVAGGILVASLISSLNSLGHLGSGSSFNLGKKKKAKKQLDTREPSTPRAAPLPSTFVH